MAYGSDEINLQLPAVFGVLVLLAVSLGALILSYLLQHRVIDFNVPPFAPSLLKGFGFFGVGLVFVIVLAIMVLSVYAPN